jgi:Transposase and inactivated derivatives
LPSSIASARYDQVEKLVGLYRIEASQFLDGIQGGCPIAGDGISESEHVPSVCILTLIAFGKRCKEAGVRPSMGSVGDCYDNAMCESFFATLECELLDRHRFRTQAEARMAIFEFLEGWYNAHRRHSGAGNLSPMEYERKHAANA